MLGILTLHPVRNKNYTSLEIGRSFKRIKKEWWLILDYTETKEGRDDERRVDPMFYSAIECYLTVHRPTLARGKENSNALWLSTNDGEPMTEKGMARAISSTTLSTVGVNVSPHLFRTSGSSTSAIYGNENPHLGSALLNHQGEAVNQKSYNWSTSISAGGALADVMDRYKD